MIFRSHPKLQHTHHTRKRAATAVMVVVTIPVMLGMAALTIDTSLLLATRAVLQHGADAAAMREFTERTLPGFCGKSHEKYVERYCVPAR